MELLAPVGSFEVLEKAISAGCDAVYLAGKDFGARAYAENFDYDNLIKAILYAHRYGVKVHVTVNTLIFDNEINNAMNFVGFLYENDVDAVIVQDLGLASLIHATYPDLALHASTQINAQTLEDVQVLKQLGFTRVILGREASLDEIKRIRESNIDIELEVFIHGALCMSYSGSCFFSSFEGGRSGNRGRCAQPCRKEYKLNGKTAYFLSPKDLCTIDEIKEIAKYVDSMKIEGRMKSAYYVYQVVRSYKEALSNNSDYEELKYNMQVAFNRGFTKGFILNTNNRDFSNTKKSNHQGVLIGEVLDSANNKAVIKIKHDLYDGDSLRLVSADNKKEDSVIISGMYVNGNLAKVAHSGDKVTIRTHVFLDKGMQVYLTKREKFDQIEKKIEISAILIDKGNEMCLSYNDCVHNVSGCIPCEEANNSLNERLITQIKKTGDSIFTVNKVNNKLSKEIYVNIKEVNELRRNLLSELTALREKNYPNRNKKDIVIPYLDIKKDEVDYPEYSILVSNKNQLNIVIDYLNNSNQSYNIYTRFDSDYYHYLPRVGKIKAGDIVSSNLGSRGRVSSVYFNVVNSYTVRVMEYLGYNKIGLSVEMSKRDIMALVKKYQTSYGALPYLEVMVYGYIELMYMKHCFLNKLYGHEKLHCGECKKDIKLDNKYSLFGDEMCHLTLLSYDPLYLLSKIEELKQIGIKSFLLDFHKESEEELIEILKEIGEPYSDGYYGHYLKEVL